MSGNNAAGGGQGQGQGQGSGNQGAGNVTQTIIQNAMPEAHKRGSPRFKTKHKEKILTFIKSFEKAARLAGLDDAQKCEQLGNYTDPEVRDFWEGID